MSGFRFRIVIPGLLVTLILAGALSLMSAPEAHACTCEMPPPPKEALEQAREVFAGTALEISEPEFGDVLTVRFEVTEAWKGVDEREIEVGTSRGGSAACGFEFQKGDEYLVYTGENQSSDGPDSVTGICHRTTDLTNAGEDLDALGEGTPGSELAEVDDTGTNGGDESEGVGVFSWLLGGIAMLVGFALMALRFLRR